MLLKQVCNHFYVETLDFSHAFEKVSLVLCIFLNQGVFFFQEKIHCYQTTTVYLIYNIVQEMVQLHMRFQGQTCVLTAPLSLTSCANMGKKSNPGWSCLISKMGIISATLQHC